MLVLALFAYAIAMTIANLMAVAFGPAITPVNAFVLIGLDLALRDWLHIRLAPKQMALLISITGLITYTLNPAAGQIAVASAMAFTAASFVDWAVFLRVRGSWIARSNASNVAGAAVDSLIFPTIAFGVVLPHIVAMQFFAKVAGGAIWSVLINRVAGKAGA